MTENRHERRRPSPAQILFLFLGGLVLYLLSPGPILWLLLEANGEASPLLIRIAPFLHTVYLPVELLQKHVPVVKSFYTAWFSLFGLGP